MVDQMTRNLGRIAHRALNGLDLGDGPVQCTIHHGTAEMVVTRGMGIDPLPLVQVQVFLDGDLPDAAFRVEQRDRVLREGRLGDCG